MVFLIHYPNAFQKPQELYLFSLWLRLKHFYRTVKTSILDRWLDFNHFNLAFRFYTVRLPKISIVLANILVWLLKNPKLRMIPFTYDLRKHSIFWFWSDFETEVFSARFSLLCPPQDHSTSKHFSFTWKYLENVWNPIFKFLCC